LSVLLLRDLPNHKTVAMAATRCWPEIKVMYFPCASILILVDDKPT